MDFDTSATMPDISSLNAIPSDSMSPIPGEATINTTPGNIWTYISSLTWQFWLIVVLVLSLIGINVFAYLAEGTHQTTSIISNVFGPILKLIGYDILETTKQAVTTGATGTKAAVTFAEDAVVGGIDAVESVGKNSGSSDQTVKADPLPPLPKGYAPQTGASSAAQQQPVARKNTALMQETTLDKALDNAAHTSAPEPSGASGSTGWCYVGTDSGVRSCAEVGVNDQCMSGDIFPSQDICVNPSLRP
jgi:hypothetical protein